MSYLRYLSTILLTLTMFYGWASPSVATSQFVCRGVGLTEPERSSLWNLSDVSTLDKAGLNLAPRYVAASVHDGDSVHTIISEIIDGRRMRYLVDGFNLIWIGEETPEMHIMVDTLCYTSALLPFGDVSIPLSLYYRSNVIRSDGALVQSATYYPYGTPHRAPKNLTAVSTTNSYLFGGKELMTQDALDEYLYGAHLPPRRHHLLFHRPPLRKILPPIPLRILRSQSHTLRRSIGSAYILVARYEPQANIHSFA